MAQAKKALEKSSRSAQSAKRIKSYHNFIGGRWIPSSSDEWLENRNPADTRDVVGRFPRSTEEDVDEAVAAAAKAFDGWRHTPAPRRAEILFRVGEILIRDKQKYTADMTREMGKVLKEAGGDVQEAIDCTYYAAGEGRRLHGFTTRAERNAICSLEMGGKNAIIIMDDADIDNAVEGAIWGAFGTSGQRCTASSRLIVHKKVYKSFSNKLVERAKTMRIGNGADPKVDVGPDRKSVV